METIFISQDLWSMVDEGYGEPPQTELPHLEQKQIRNATVKKYLF